jgi:hypothetical protein
MALQQLPRQLQLLLLITRHAAASGTAAEALLLLQQRCRLLQQLAELQKPLQPEVPVMLLGMRLLVTQQLVPLLPLLLLMIMEQQQQQLVQAVKPCRCLHLCCWVYCLLVIAAVASEAVVLLPCALLCSCVLCESSPGKFDMLALLHVTCYLILAWPRVLTSIDCVCQLACMLTCCAYVLVWDLNQAAADTACCCCAMLSPHMTCGQCSKPGVAVHKVCGCCAQNL